jgi:hypothetical protein
MAIALKARPASSCPRPSRQDRGGKNHTAGTQRSARGAAERRHDVGAMVVVVAWCVCPPSLELNTE